MKNKDHLSLCILQSSGGKSVLPRKQLWNDCNTLLENYLICAQEFIVNIKSLGPLVHLKIAVTMAVVEVYISGEHTQALKSAMCMLYMTF